MATTIVTHINQILMKQKKSIFYLMVFISFIACKEIDPNKQIDEGKIENDTYKSEEIGWQMSIPKGYEIVTKSESEKIDERGLQAMQETTGETYDISELKNLLSFKKNRFNVFTSTSEPFIEKYDGEWIENNSSLKKLIYLTYQNQGIKSDSTKTQIEKIDGLDFQFYEFNLYGPENNVVLNQRFYSRLINGFDFGVNINSNNENEKKAMLNAWKNSKFSTE